MDDTRSSGKAVTEALLHYGVKGMKWGVRKKNTPQSRVTLSTGSITGALKSKGGEGRKPSEDAKRAKVYGQIVKKSGTQALSNKQLREYIDRMDLEKRADKVYSETSLGWTFVDGLLRKK